MTVTQPSTAERVAAVRQTLSAGSLDEAVTDARALLEAHPSDLRCRLLWAELLAAQDKRAEVVDYASSLLKQWPDNPWVLSRLVSAYVANGDADAALSLYRDKVEPSALPEADKTRIARNLAAANRSHPQALVILEQRLSAAPDDPALARDSASALFALGRLDEAVDRFERAARLAPLPAWAAFLHVTSLVQRRRLAGTVPVVDAAILDCLGDALKRFPDDALFVRAFNGLPIASPDWHRLYRLIRSHVSPARTNGLLQFETAKACLQAGEPETTRAILQGLDPASHWGTVAKPLLSVLDTLPDTVWQRARFDDDPAAEVQIVRREGARRTIVVFATLTGNFMMLPLACLDALLADVPANVVYLRDTVFGSAISGLRSLGPDISSTVSHLRRLIADLGAPELTMVGASVSGLSAIRYGARLGADRATCFGALTTVDPEFQGTPSRLQRTLRVMQQDSAATERFDDVVTELAQAPGMGVEMFVGDACELDLKQAARLETIPQIHIHHEADVAHHYVALAMIARHRFVEAITGQAN
ncbi:hypothetical protein DLJ53_20430 [Acuticoccus sediminis]|uniref:Tetratricopeptide repeat protein n=1 Tax=Acuticoccus sediminis TaxID=2184697 RepID=A0A8B2NKR1_9HYPH|nr:tetratricopeptide repeat protein [Acuticoccus sediminis]RAI00086.1 hypothetical protein DLJ53_20430 [Acuticoccus sediminis]